MSRLTGARARVLSASRGAERAAAPVLLRCGSIAMSHENMYFAESELCNGTLNDRCTDDARSWPWPDRLRALGDVAEGMAQVHALGYQHGDLEGSNLMRIGPN